MIIYCHVSKQTIWLRLRSRSHGSSEIRTRDLSVSSLTRCHLSYRASFFYILLFHLHLLPVICLGNKIWKKSNDTFISQFLESNFKEGSPCQSYCRDLLIVNYIVLPKSSYKNILESCFSTYFRQSG